MEKRTCNYSAQVSFGSQNLGLGKYSRRLPGGRHKIPVSFKTGSEAVPTRPKNRIIHKPDGVVIVQPVTRFAHSKCQSCTIGGRGLPLTTPYFTRPCSTRSPCSWQFENFKTSIVFYHCFLLKCLHWNSSQAKASWVHTINRELFRF